MSDTTANLLTRLQVLEDLNPDTAALAQDELLALAETVAPGDFHRVAGYTEELVKAYLASPIKQAQTRLFADYFSALTNATHLLAAQGDIERDEASAAPGNASVAMVANGLYSPLEWMRIQGRAAIPENLQHAVAASQQRHRYVASVLEVMFLVLQRLDAGQAFAWQLAYIQAQRGSLDADVVRDLLRAWLPVEPLPAPLLEWVLQWSCDENLGRQWPAVIHVADDVLRRQLLHAWAKRHADGGPSRLRLLLRSHPVADDTLMRWVAGSVADIGESVQFFVTVSEEMNAAPPGTAPDWRSAALYRELKNLADIFEPVELMADMMLRDPGGVTRFAMALFGLGQSGSDLWRHRVHAQAEKLIRRLFLQGLRTSTPPETTIRNLCFGDRGLFTMLMLQLDFGSHEFDSLQQRDKVVKRLAEHYINRREYQLMAQEIGRRFRCLLRVLHADNLHRLLTPPQFAELSSGAAFHDLIGLLAGARRYLDRRRDLELALEDILAAEDVFAADIRQRRQRLLRQLLF